MAIRRDTLTATRDLRATVGDEADQAVRDTTATYADAWKQAAPEYLTAATEIAALAAALGRWPYPYELARAGTLRAALTHSQAVLTTSTATAATAINGSANATIAATGHIEPAVIATQVPAAERAHVTNLVAGRVTAPAVDIVTARAASRITAVTRPVPDLVHRAIERVLTRGIAAGDNPRTVAAALLARIQGVYTLGLDRALTIARTEILDAYRAASAMVHTANRDVLDGWVWLADLGRRCCPACWAMHGTTHPIDEPGPNDHPNGRCARVPKVRPWADLGISTPEPPDLIPDARARFAALSPADQAAIMGPGRLDLLTSGRIQWDDLATTRTNHGWRDSTTPTPVRDLQRRAAAPAT